MTLTFETLIVIIGAGVFVVTGLPLVLYVVIRIFKYGLITLLFGVAAITFAGVDLSLTDLCELLEPIIQSCHYFYLWEFSHLIQ